MARNGGSRVLYVALLFIVAGSCGRLENLKSEEDSKENLKVDQEQVADHHTHHGRLVIGQNSFTFKGSKRRRLPAADAGYQADMRWMQPPQRGPKLFQQRPNDVTMEQIMKMEPKVECLAGSMKLEVQNSPATSGSLFLIDRGSQLSPLPISKLPSSCGYTTKSTRRDLVMVAPYDGCFVNQEEDNYVLSMLWLGVPVKMLCPQVRPCLSNPPMVACYAEGMVVKMDWPLSDIKVNVSGDWERLMTASQRCGFGIVEHSEGVVVSVDYRFCLQKKDGMYKLELFGDGKSIISCPLMSEGQPEWTGEIFSLPEQKPGTPQGPGYPMVYPTYPPWPEPKPAVQKPGTPQGPGYPMVYPTYPPWPEPKPAVQKPGTPQGPGYPMVYPTYPPWPEPKPAVQKPGTPQGPGYPMVYPTYPPWPEPKPAVQKPGTPQGPGYPMVYPTYPPWPEPKPAVQKPGTPQGPGYPMVYPTYPPWPEQKPAVQKPGTPQGPGYPMVYPTYPPWPEPKPAVQKPGTPQGPGYPMVYPTYPPWPEQKPAVQKPGTPQGPGYPMVYPTYPPWPEQKPAVQKPGTPQGPGYPMVYPTYPPWPEPKPAVQKPGTPQGPGYPMVYPTYPPWPEQKPAVQKPGTPQGPGYPMVYPTYPPWPEQKPAIQKPGTPQGPGYPMVYPTYPPWPEQKPAVQKPGTPQGPGYPMVYPTYPPCLEQKPGVNPACHLQPGEKPAFQQPEAPSGKVNTSSYSSHPENQPEGEKPVQWPGVWPGQLNPNVYPSYPQHSQKPGMPPSEEYWKPIYYPLYPDHNDKKPALNPTTWPPTTEKPTQVQKPYLPQSPPGKPVENNGQVSQYLYGYYHPPPVGQNPEEPSVLQPNSGGVVGLQSSLSMPPLYCACPSGFGNCCPQIAFHQHHHHILPVGPGSGAVPPIYTGLPFAPLVAVPVFEGDSRPPAPQKPNEPTLTPDPPTSSPPESEKQLYFQPPDGSLTAILESLSLSPEQAYAYLDPREVSQYWSYSPLSAGQDSGQEPVNPIAQLHPYMLQRPKEQYQSSPGNTNSELVSHFYHPKPQQQEAMRKPKPLSAKPWARYDVLQDAHVPTKNISALPRSPTVNRSNNKRDRQVNASSESNGYILLQHGPPGKVPHRFESPLDLRRPAHLGTDQGHSDKSPEDLKPSNENAEPTRQRKGTHASFPNFWTRTISKRTIRPHALQKASRQWVSPAEQKAKD